MNQMRIRTESLCKRCEICHQTDFFNQSTNTCFRCNQLPIVTLPKISETKIKIPKFLTTCNKDKDLFPVVKNTFFYLSVLPYIFLFFTESVALVLGSNIILLFIGLSIAIEGKIRGESISKTITASLFACGLVLLIAVFFVIFYFYPPSPSVSPCCEDF